MDQIDKINIKAQKQIEQAGSELEKALVDENKVIVKKYSSKCVFGDSTDDVVNYKNKKICSTCISTIREKV